MSSSSEHITSNRNNRNLTRADDRSFRRRAASLVGKGFSPKTTYWPSTSRKRRAYQDQTSPLKYRLIFAGGLVIIAITLAYKLITMWDWLG